MPFTPLFHYQSGKAVTVYFEKEEMKTAEEGFIKYYLQNPKQFEKDIKEYRTLYEEAMIAADKKDIATLFGNVVKMWPTLNAIMSLGEMKAADRLAKNLKDVAIQARNETDQFMYNIGNKIWDSIGSFADDDAKSMLTIEEIIDEKCPSPEDIYKRKQEFIYTNDGLITGISFADFLKESDFTLEGEQTADDISEFSGDVAYAGKATERVRLVLEYKDMYEFEEGEVLVSSMTVPDFLPVMKKASAFITDEGGVTCHAAVIAREMKKPCIIGTKVATQILKNGDEVEVDANSGIIKIIN